MTLNDKTPTVSPSGKILLEKRGDVLIVSLNDPDRLNATSPEMASDLSAVLDRIDAGETGARAMILTGSGKAFCSGANLSVHATNLAAQGSFDPGALLEAITHPMLRKLRTLCIPWVAAVNGPAAGIGMAFALHGDLVVMAEDAYLLAAYSRIGLTPDGGSSWLLPRIIGHGRAKQIMLLGGKIEAQQALDWGLAAQVHPREALTDGAIALAERLAKGPASLRLTRELFWASFENDFEAQIALERRNLGKAGATKDFQEGVKAFLDKRAPAFTGT